MLKSLTIAAVLATASPVLAQSGGDMTPNSVDVVEAASSAGNFNTLLEVVADAGLAETLANSKDVTVLASIDPAFTAVPDLLALQADKEKLAQVLKYHVIPKAYMAEDIPAGDTEVETLSGEKLTLTNDNGSISIITPSGVKAKVVQQDIKADNGVVHAIYHVLMP